MLQSGRTVWALYPGKPGSVSGPGESRMAFREWQRIKETMALAISGLDAAALTEPP